MLKRDVKLQLTSVVGLKVLAVKQVDQIAIVDHTVAQLRGFYQCMMVCVCASVAMTGG